MIFSIFRDFFANIANFFSSKSTQSNSQSSPNPQSQTRGSKLSSSIVKFTGTLLGEAKKSVTRAVPTLKIVNIRFSSARKKYVKDKKISQKLTAKTYALGRDTENKDAVLGQVITPAEAIFVNNSHVSKHHLSINREIDKNNRDKYLLKYIKTTNGTFQRQPLWASLLFWQNGKDYRNKWIWKYKRVSKDTELRDGDIFVIEERGKDDKTNSTRLKFVYPPVWYVRLGIYAAQGLFALIILYILACWLLVRSVADVAVDPLPNSPAPLAIYANDSKTLMTGSVDGKATPHQEKKQLSEFPKLLVGTLMESEDKNFYRHNGINPFRIVTAAIGNLLRGGTQGASTIDQQLARTLFAYEVSTKDMWGNQLPYDPQNPYDPENGVPDTLDRKIREAAIALKLNYAYPKKDEILLAYLNSVDLGYRNTGERVRGFVDASLFYFNKPVESLSEKSPEDVASIANLVVLLRSPSIAKSLCDKRIDLSNLAANDPNDKLAADKQEQDDKGRNIARENAISLKNDKNTLINAIRDRGYVSAKVATEAKAVLNYTLFANKAGFCQGSDTSTDNYKYSPYFMANRIREEMRVILSISKQEKKDQGSGVFYNYIVVTSLDVEKQDKARRLLEKSVERLWQEKAVPHGALITIDSKNGEILALVGDIKRKVKSSDKVESPDLEILNDYGAKELLSPASTFKMFFYTAALKGGLKLDESFLCDSLEFEGETFPVSNYSNYCASGNRAIDVRTAVAISDNLVPLKVVKKYASLAEVVNTARDMGLRSQLEPPTSLMAYGQYKAVLREMAGAYAVLANGGKYNFPHAIQAIYVNTNKDDCDSTAQKFKNCPLRYDSQKDVRLEKQVIAKEVADKMTELFRAVVSSGSGTGRNADIRSAIGKDIAGKTGTSEDYRDGWFIGYIPNELVTGVWLGNFNHVPNPPPTQNFTSGDAAQLWGDYMLKCHQLKGCG